MNNKYMRFAGLVLIAASLGFVSCDKDNDVDGTLEKVDLLSEITIEKTIYHTGDQSMCMLPGQEIQMNCVVGSPDALNKNYVWTSSDETVASITPMGYLITKKAGEAVISVTPEIGFGSQGATPAVVLKVVDSFMYIDEIEMEEEEKTALETDGIWQNQSYQVTVSALPKDATFKRYKWESDNENIVTVNQEGVITGVGAGTAIITVTADDFSVNPATYEFQVKVKPIVEIESFEFKSDSESNDVKELSALGYGQEIDMNTADVIRFNPEDATPYLLKWSSSNSNVVSITEDGKLKVNTTTSGTAELTATYNGISQTKTVTVAEGRLWYSFGNGITPWSLESSDKSSVFESRDGKTTIKMGVNDKSKCRGDLVFVRNGGEQTKITPSVYQYLAVKININTNLTTGSNANGCIKLELWNNSDPRIIGDQYLGKGDKLDANNAFMVLNETGTFKAGTNVIYYDLQSNYNKTTPTDWNQTFTLDQLKFVIADFPSTVNQYDIYWVRSFKTFEELKAYVASENTTDEVE